MDQTLTLGERHTGSGARTRELLRRARRLRGRGEWLLIAGLTLSLGYYYVVPQPLVALPGLLVYALLAWLRLDLTLALLPLAFPYWYVPKRVAGHVVFPLSEIALAVCAALALAQLASLARRARGRAVLAREARRLARQAGPWLLWGTALLVLGLSVGVVVARRPHDALRAWRWEALEPLVYTVLVLGWVRGRRVVRLLLWALLGSALVVAALAAIQVFWLHVTFTPLASGNQLVPFGSGAGVPRATAFIYGSGNSLGAWLARALPLALALALGGREIAARERALALAVALACVPPLVWSASRGAWVAAALACVVVVLLSPLRRQALVVLAALALVAVVVAHDALVRMLALGHGDSAEMRLFVWLAAVHMIRDHPVFGIGPDQFLYYYSNRYTTQPYWITVFNGHATPVGNEPTLAQPHNLLLEFWLSGGLLALAGFALVLGQLWGRCLRVWRATRARLADGWRGAAALGVGASVLAGVIHGMVDSAYFAPDLALAFWGAVALALLLARG
jgi:putative inorganic carbon (HCO3(-)) transporter